MPCRKSKAKSPGNLHTLRGGRYVLQSNPLGSGISVNGVVSVFGPQRHSNHIPLLALISVNKY